MARIQRLSPHIADLIAAGEVVERPGSVVKELIENSIDAGASVLTVEIKNGGMTYIRVTDNGCGMSPDDAETAFLRHATSKLRSENDLAAIGTLGFRGEALAAISAVSRIHLKTCERGAAEGTELCLEGGEITYRSSCGCPSGTTVIVSDLFFNTPARLKFMKNDRAEGANVSAVVLRCALSHPEVSIKYIKDGKPEFHTAGDGRMDSCIYTLLGRETAGNMLKVSTEQDGVSVEGYVSTPAGARGNRTYQFFFINGRHVKSKLLQAALEQAYKNSLFTGRFPACVLYMTLPLTEVDVNVHPTKSEVKFLHEKAAFDGVYYAVLAALDNEREKADVSAPDDVLSEISEPEFKTLKPTPLFGAESGSFAKYDRAPKSRSNIPGASGGAFRTMTADAYRSAYSEEKSTLYNTDYSPSQLKLTEPASGGSLTLSDSFTDGAAQYKNDGCGWRVAGEVMATYIIVEQGESMYLIDKHAAHERIKFNELKEQGHVPMTQILLAPVIFELSADDADILCENEEFFQNLGFCAELLGDGRAVVREAPEDVGDIRAVVTELCEKLRQGRREDAETRRDTALRTIACKSAVRAGKSSSPAELAEICRRVMSGEVRYCPHGRPVMVEISKNQIDKWFRRI